MTARKVLLSLVIIIIFFVGVVEGSTQTVISTKNEFGGKTVEEAYSPDDTESSDTTKIITYNNDINTPVKKEYFFTAESADENGASRGIVYLGSNGDITKKEVFYTGKSSDENGVSRGSSI